MSGFASTPEFWESHYRDADPSWGTRVNAPIRAALDRLDLAPGRAVDLGCGHGGDAVALAEAGWQVTAVDASATAIDRVRELAERHGVSERIATRVLDLDTQTPEGEVELALAAFVHSAPGLDRDALLRRVAERIVPGGVMLVVDHSSLPPWSWGHGTAIAMPSPEERLRAHGLAEGWEPLIVERISPTAEGPGGQEAEVSDDVIALRRPLS